MLRANESGALTGDKIAIVGMGCLLPGGIQTPAALWSFLREGREAVADVPADRWNMKAFYDPDPAAPGKLASRRGAFLRDIAAFDAAFFGISSREAAVMDPQQRLLLETAWRAFEDAGIPPEALAGSRTGVFIGISHSDYHAIQQFGRQQIDLHTGTGGALSIAANRLSHRFDLRGPSLAIDTACSSSLVALDAACTALLNGDCEMALVGGVNAILTPDVSISFSRASMLSPDGRCKAFDERANGYVRGEGCGLVILQPLARAQSEGARCHAVIRATSVNQDGRTSTITVPSRDAQVAMLRDVCRKAEIDPADIGYVEAHGTGTAVGDPIEGNALGSVFGSSRDSEHPCIIGSIKTNIGHLEPAAGIAGLIKAVLCVQHGEIPPSLHFESPNPNIDFAALKIRVASELAKWPDRSEPRRAVVNSFGFGGTNACAVIEQAPVLRRPAVVAKVLFDGPVLLPISAASPTALAAVGAQLSDVLASEAVSLANAAGTMALRRSHLGHRSVIIADSTADAVAKLRGVTAGANSPGVISGRPGIDARVAFVFTGQGAQWAGMGKRLLARDRIFRESVERCDALFAELAGWSIIDELDRDDRCSRMDETAVAQPATFALQVGLAERLAAWGVRPAAVIGHSIGEMAAAYIAGALSLSDAVRVVYHRSRLQERSRRLGGMAAVGLSASDARERIAEFEGAIEVAAINGPALVTLAGDHGSLDRFMADLQRERDDVLCQRLRIDYAFHSRRMDPFSDELRAALAPVKPQKPLITMYSTVTARAVTAEELDADYWCRNMRQPVLFSDAVDAALYAGLSNFIELGAHPALTVAVKACLAERSRDGVVVPTLRRDCNDEVALSAAAAEMHVHGIAVDWKSLAPSAWNFAELPGYPWEKKNYWAESEQSRAARLDAPVHPLLGLRQRTALPIWQTEISLNSPAYLADHRVENSVVFPAAAYVELMLAAAREWHQETLCELETIAFHEALMLSAEQWVFIETSLDETRGAVQIRSRSRDSNEWTLRATGRIAAWTEAAPVLTRWEPKVEPPWYASRARFYRRLAEEGHRFGPAFQAVEALWHEENEVLGRIELPQAAGNSAEYVIHPALLDACFQVIRGFRGFGDHDVADSLALPTDIASMRLYRRPQGSVFSRAHLVIETQTQILVDIVVVDETGAIVATINGFRCRRIPKSAVRQAASGLCLYREQWTPLPDIESDNQSNVGQDGTWLLLTDRAGFGDGLADLLRTGGRPAALVHSGLHARQISSDRYETPLTAEGLSTTIDAIGPLAGIVHLCSLDDFSEQPTAQRIEHAQQGGVEALIALTRALEGVAAKPPLWIVTAGAAPWDGFVSTVRCGAVMQSAMIGFVRSLANEMPELRPRWVDLDPDAMQPGDLAAELLTAGAETEVSIRGGQRFGCRLNPVSADALPRRHLRWNAQTRTPAFQLTMSAPGVIDHLYLDEIHKPTPGPGTVLIEIHAVGLNFRDILAATGVLPAGAEDEPAWKRLGLECAGIVRSIGEGVEPAWLGARAIAVAPASFASHVVVPEALAFKIPHNLSFENAVSIPTAFATARYAMVTLARLVEGESVLIHSATGGVGLAAVAIARARKLEIFATAGDPVKRDYLRALGIKHVFDSRSPAFADEVMRATGERGVDAVLNSLSGHLLEKSLSVLAPGGRFLEIGKRDIYADTPIGLHALHRNGAIFAIDLARIAAERPEVLRKEISEIIDDLSSGRLEPLSVSVFPLAEVRAAFHQMAKARHIGKIVVTMDSGLPAEVLQQRDALPLVRTNATYLVTGGTRGFGLAAAQWLVGFGAQSLILVGRSGLMRPESRAIVDDMRDRGIDVAVLQADVASEEGVRTVLSAAAATGLPLRGVIHAAGVIEDALLTELKSEQVRRVFGAKVLGAWHLHEFTQSEPLDFFVLFSSVAAAIGTIGQSHYAAANRTLDAIAGYRRSCGLPALSVNWGPIKDYGYVVRRPEVARYLESGGVNPAMAATALSQLATLLQADPVSIVQGDVIWTKLARGHAAVGSSPRTAHLRAAGTNDGRERGGLRAALVSLGEPERTQRVTEFLRTQIAAVLKVEPQTLEMTRPLNELGLDSLTSFELKNRVEAELGLSLPIGKFLQRPTIAGIVPTILERAEATVGQSLDSSRENAGLAGPVMSPGQESLWFIDQLDPSSTAYGLAMCISVRPKLLPSFVDEAFRRVVMRHESLRLAFVADGIGPMPTFVDVAAFHIVQHDASAWSEAELTDRLDEEANSRFWLAAGPLVKLHLFQREDNDIVLLHLHHIVADATSIALIVEEMFETYVALGAGLPLVTQGDTSSFSEFAMWQHRLLASPEADAHRQFWAKQLADRASGFVLPTDHPRPPRQGGPGASRNFIVDSIGTQDLTQIARREQTTLFAVLLAAFNVLLHRESGNDDLIVGVPVNGRTRPEFERLVGHLVNALPVRTKMSGDVTFLEILHRVDAVLRAVLEHQDYPFASIVKDLGATRNVDHSPIFDVMFSMERAASIDQRGITVTLLNSAGPTVRIRDFTVAALPLRRDRAQFDFTFTVEDFGGQIYGVVDYRSDLWNAASIDRLIDKFREILRVLAQDPNVALSELWPGRAPVLTGPSLAEIPDVIDSIRAAAAIGPDQRAVIGPDAELTYRQLIARAEAVAAGLQMLGVEPASLVAISMERSSLLPVAMLGALMAGAAYVPIDPSYPPARIAAILADTEPAMLISDHLESSVAGLQCPTAAIDNLLLAAGYRPCTADDAAIAYVIHTSGSTGRPAGVEVYRTALNNFLAGMRLSLPLNRSDCLLAITTPAFDIAALELLLPLTIGAVVVIADEVTARDGRALSARLECGDITTLQATPATWQMLIDAGWRGCRSLRALCGGEALPRDLAQNIRSRVGNLWNLYGPTEATIWSSICEVQPEDRAVTLGLPIANTEFRVVSDDLESVASGMIGELLIGGAGLARGYLNDPKRSAERFIADPSNPERQKRWFRTGDMVRIEEDGSLVFVGRQDDQIKIRGFRVELGDIEATLRTLPGVKAAAVVPVGDSLAARHIVSFVVVGGGQETDSTAILERARELLPAHMVPASIRIIDALPQTLNGKVDRKRLAAEARRPWTLERPRTPLGPVETTLVAIMSDVLGHHSFDARDDFFSIGGTSLLGMRYVARIGAAFGVEIDARDLMQASTIEAMARRIAFRSATGPRESAGGISSEPAARSFWRPLSLARAEGAFPAVDAAAIVYLPDDLMRVGSHQNLRRSSDGAAHWTAVGRSDLGTLALITIPRFGRELLASPEDAILIIDGAIEQAVRLGARQIALTGIIPAVTELGAALAVPSAATLTTGHATTACAMVLSIAAAAEAAGRDLSAESIAFVGLGAIGTATLRLMLDRLPPPSSLVLCDLPSKRGELKSLAQDLRKSGVSVRVVEARQRVPEEVYQTRFIVGATNAADVIDVDRLQAGTIIVDDSFPYCFDLNRAIERSRDRQDILLMSGGRLAPPPGLHWLFAIPPDMAIAAQRVGRRDLFPSLDDMAGCMLSALLPKMSAPPTIGRVTLDAMRNHWTALRRMNIGAAPLRCGSWSPDSQSLSNLQSKFQSV